MNIEEYDKETMEDIGIISDILNKEKMSLTDDDIDKRLQHFHKKHKKKGNLLSAGTMMKISLSAAAAIALALVLHKSLKSSESAVVLQTTDKGLVATNDFRTSTATRQITANKNSVNSEDELESEEIDKLFADADTIKLNVSKGHSCKVVLPDGSCAFVHPDTKLMYPKQFVGNERRVTLDGEAYFIVKKDREHPFIVGTASSETLVTGTEFNVKASEKINSTVKVTLVNGSVQFSNKQNKQRVFLTPGKEAVMKSNSPIFVCDADTMKYVAWRDGYFYFDDVRLEDILIQICQSYNVKTVCSNNRLTQYRMHFLLRRDLELSEVVNSLNRMKKVKVSLNNGTLYVKER